MSGPRMVPIYGTSSDDVGKRWFVDLYNQWPGVLRPKDHGWIDFTLIDLTGEFSPYKGSCEVSVALLGLRVTITYVYSPAIDAAALADADATLGIGDSVKESAP